VPENENRDAVESPRTLEVVTTAAGAAVPTDTIVIDLNGFGAGISVVERE
jgi:hypothetical protein